MANMVVGQETKTSEDINVKATAFLPIHTETAREQFKPGTLSFILSTSSCISGAIFSHAGLKTFECLSTSVAMKTLFARELIFGMTSAFCSPCSC